MIKITKIERPVFQQILDTGELTLAEYKDRSDYKKISRICISLFNKGAISREEIIGYDEKTGPFRQVRYITNIFSFLYEGGFKNEN